MVCNNGADQTSLVGTMYSNNTAHISSNRSYFFDGCFLSVWIIYQTLRQLGCLGINWYVLVWFGILWFTGVCTGILLFVAVDCCILCACYFQYVLIFFVILVTLWSNWVCSHMVGYVRVHFLMFWLFFYALQTVENTNTSLMGAILEEYLVK